MIDLYSSSSSVVFESILKKAFSNRAVVGTEELLLVGEAPLGGDGLFEPVLDVPLFADLPLLGGLADISIPLKFQSLSFGSSIAPPFKVLVFFCLDSSSKVVIAGNNNIVMS